MDLPKLPKLPRSGAKQRSAMPGLGGKATDRRLPDEVEEAAPREADEVDRDPYGFGEEEPGRWFETGQRLGSIGGRCGNCGRKRKAENLELKQRPFGRGEYWGCKEGC